METALSKVKNNNVFLRVDFDVPLEKGLPTNTYRIDRCMDTIDLLLKNNNKVVLFTKLGRPEKKEKSLSTYNLLNYLRTKIESVFFVRSIEELEMALKMDTNKLILYENTRFFNWEKSPQENKEKITKISKLFDIYVDEAFAMSHRQEASNYYIALNIGQYAIGENYKKEIEYLGKIKKGDMEKPALFVLGGAKPETKIPMISKLNTTFTYFLVGGKLAADPAIIEIATKNKNVIPMKLTENGFDINSKSIDIMQRAIKLAKTIVWNGPVGMFEKLEYAAGTKKLIESLESKKTGLVVAGGGDTISAIELFGSIQNYTFVSTGGGAMFSYLAGNKTNIDLVQQNLKA